MGLLPVFAVLALTLCGTAYVHWRRSVAMTGTAVIGIIAIELAAYLILCSGYGATARHLQARPSSAHPASLSPI